MHWCMGGHHYNTSSRVSNRAITLCHNLSKITNSQLNNTHRRRRRGAAGAIAPQVSGRGAEVSFRPQVLSLKNTNKEALSTPQPLSSNYHE